MRSRFKPRVTPHVHHSDKYADCNVRKSLLQYGMSVDTPTIGVVAMSGKFNKMDLYNYWG